MKVLHVAETVIGGIATHLNNCMPAQIEMFGKDRVVALVPHQHLGHLDVSLTQQALAYNRPGRWKGLIKLVLAYRKAVAEFRPDIVHAHSTFAGVVARLFTPNRGVKIVYCPHGWAFDMQKGMAWRFVSAYVERALAPFSDAIIAISQHELRSADALGIMPRGRVVIIENGISDERQEVDPVSNWPEDKLRVLFVGRLDRQKGSDILLTAAKAHNNIHICLAGDAIVDGGKSEHKATSVTYLGWLNARAIRSYMHSCDVVVMPSRWEGFGLVAIEAMRASKAVIASRVGGLQELVLEGETGHLFESENIEQLSKILSGLDKANLTRMGRNGRLRYELKYTSDQMNNKMRVLYSELLPSSSLATGNYDATFR